MYDISKVKLNLYALLDSIEKIENYSKDFDSAEEFYNDVKSFDATMMQFVVIGETISRLDERFKQEYNNIPWKKIKNFRNIIAHDYFGIDADEIWSIITFHLLPLKENIASILENL